MPGGVGSGVKKGTKRGHYAKTAEKLVAEKLRKSAKDVVEAENRRRLE